MKLISKSFLSLMLIAGAAPAYSEDVYHLGEGYNVGNINVAGYINLEAEIPRDDKAAIIGDDFSLFISGHINKYFNPFFEAEISGITFWREGGSILADNHPDYVVERLYNDSNLTENLTLRIGKMLSPVGEWNTIHAAPLVWTTTRPLTTFRSYSEYTSGFALNYLPQNGKLPELQLLWQPDGDFLPKPRTLVVRQYQHITGVHLNWTGGLTDKLGFSLQHADVKKSNETQTLLGINFKKTIGQFQFETEATHTHISGDNPARIRDNEWGAYALGAYAINEKLSAMARYEQFNDRDENQSSRNALLGLIWRPESAIAWKLEYVNQEGAKLGIGTGLYGSFSVLF
jgi:hypothetical protein